MDEFFTGNESRVWCEGSPRPLAFSSEQSTLGFYRRPLASGGRFSKPNIRLASAVQIGLSLKEHGMIYISHLVIIIVVFPHLKEIQFNPRQS
jgi:hypothetical protein